MGIRIMTRSGYLVAPFCDFLLNSKNYLTQSRADEATAQACERGTG